MGQLFTFCRFSRKRKLFRNFDCDFRKRFTKGFFLTEYEEFRNFHLTASSRYLQTAALKYYEYQLTKRCLEGRLSGSKVSSWFLKIMRFVEYRIARKCYDFHHYKCWCNRHTWKSWRHCSTHCHDDLKIRSISRL